MKKSELERMVKREKRIAAKQARRAANAPREEGIARLKKRMKGMQPGVTYQVDRDTLVRGSTSGGYNADPDYRGDGHDALR